VITPAVTVALQDAFGNTVPLAVDSITVLLGANPAGGALSGTKTKITSGGVAAFAGLKINKPGTGYTLRATSAAGLPAITGAAFNVTP